VNFSTLPEFDDSICMSQPVTAVAELVGPVARLSIVMKSDSVLAAGDQFMVNVRTAASAVDAISIPPASAHVVDARTMAIPDDIPVPFP
jgi:hypothetical protein